mmetsp:Transcript_26288/g.40185  ORF Transcript_26288/g.40185 Transcript_26288/m.40185 type:complete len:104 (-) Transcript_26288:99-410(-)
MSTSLKRFIAKVIRALSADFIDSMRLESTAFFELNREETRLVMLNAGVFINVDSFISTLSIYSTTNPASNTETFDRKAIGILGVQARGVSLSPSKCKNNDEQR